MYSIKSNDIFGHIMIMCSVAAHTSTASGIFFLLNQHVKPFCVIYKFLPANIFDNFLIVCPSFNSTNFNVRN